MGSWQTRRLTTSKNFAAKADYLAAMADYRADMADYRTAVSAIVASFAAMLHRCCR
jgi:hypothetical protein